VKDKLTNTYQQCDTVISLLQTLGYNVPYKYYTASDSHAWGAVTSLLPPYLWTHCYDAIVWVYKALSLSEVLYNFS